MTTRVVIPDAVVFGKPAEFERELRASLDALVADVRVPRRPSPADMPKKRAKR